MRKPLGYRPERDVQKSICEVLDLYGVIYSVTDASRSFTKKGEVRHKVREHWPDITGVMQGGRAICIEVKTLTGRVSDGQLAMIEAMSKAGALAFIAQSAHDVHVKLKAEKLAHPKNYKNGKPGH